MAAINTVLSGILPLVGKSGLILSLSQTTRPEMGTAGGNGYRTRTKSSGKLTGPRSDDMVETAPLHEDGNDRNVTSGKGKPGRTLTMPNSLLSTIQRWQRAVDVPVTRTPTEYISGLWALNLSDGNEVGGDWHKACWFMGTRVDSAGPPVYRGPTVRVLGDKGVYDCRKALRRMRHVQGWRSEPIWAARYARACVDMVAWNIDRETREGLPEEWWGLEPTAADLMGWLFDPHSRARVFAFCEEMARADRPTRDWWREWIERRQREIRLLYGAEAWRS